MVGGGKTPRLKWIKCRGRNTSGMVMIMEVLYGSRGGDTVHVEVYGINKVVNIGTRSQAEIERAKRKSRVTERRGSSARGLYHAGGWEGQDLRRPSQGVGRAERDIIVAGQRREARKQSLSGSRLFRWHVAV